MCLTQDACDKEEMRVSYTGCVGVGMSVTISSSAVLPVLLVAIV